VVKMSLFSATVRSDDGFLGWRLGRVLRNEGESS
jgi:hypothetical protein